MRRHSNRINLVINQYLIGGMVTFCLCLNMYTHTENKSLALAGIVASVGVVLYEATHR